MMTKRLIICMLTAALLLPGCGKEQNDDQGIPSGPETLSQPKAETDALDDAHYKTAAELINRGVRFLLDNRDNDGAWSIKGKSKPPVTALALKVLLGHPDFDASSPVVKKGFEVLLSYRQDNGGIYDVEEGYYTYSTAVAVSALAAAQNPQFDDEIRAAQQYLRGVQIIPGAETPDGEVVEQGDPRVGGIVYKKGMVKPNLSVLNYWMEAMRDSGVSPDDPAIKRAEAFLTRLQNRSESNPIPWAAKGADDGGFVYGLHESKAGAASGGHGLRSYGSMTYAGFKSMLYAGVAKDDPRVRAAYHWIRRYWRLDSNPNMPQARSMQGLYYYYQVFAKALRAWGQDVITDTDGVKHNWRHEIIGALAERVRPDGSWVNQASRWMEASPTLVTCYAVIALQETLKE